MKCSQKPVPRKCDRQGLNLLGVAVVTFIFDVAEFFCNSVQGF